MNNGIWKKIKIAVAIFAAAIFLVIAGFFLGFKTGEHLPQNLTITGINNISEGQPPAVDFSSFWQTWKIIDENYLNSKNISSQNKVYGAIQGLVDALGDPYSVFLNPSDNETFQQDVQGNFGGIGAEIGIKNNQIVVIAPLKNTPASAAGLKDGDKILNINSTSTVNMTIDEAVSLIRGPEGTPVVLTIMRDGFQKPKDITIVRGHIVAPTVEYKMLDSKIADIQIDSFNANTEYLFYQEELKALTDGAKGEIIDLRDDPGGYLDVAVNIAGWFLPKGSLVVSEKNASGTMQEIRADGNEALLNMPTVVLINGGSASAAEILAGTLRDNRHIQLVGEKSFGKGTVQELFPLNDGSYLKLTIAHWVLPSGKILENGGLVPDVEVKMNDSDIANNLDPQLDKAIEILKTKI